VSVLDSVLAHHSIGVSNVEVLSSPVHVQSVDIVSVDGEPVGPDNFAARDLVTELAALDPSVRPDEIGSPWPIQSPGFFSDSSSVAALHLAFEMPGTNASAAEAAGYAGAGGGVGQPAAQMDYAIGAAPAPAVAQYPAGQYPAVAAQSLAAQPGAPAQSGASAQPQVVGSSAPGTPSVAQSGAAVTPPVEPSTAASVGSGKTATTTPFPGGWTPSRADMGYDGTFKGQIVAPMSGTITYAARSFSNWGGYVQLKADHAFGQPSRTFYFAEGLAPTVTAGQHVSAGQPIANAAASRWNGIVGNIEWGLAQDGAVGTPTNPLAESGVSNPAGLVRGFLSWAESALGLPAPTSTDHAGYA
jgi:biotin carboxyl carrier protein